MIRKIISAIILMLFILLIVGIVGPYWHKYWIGQDIDAAAIFGTKNSVQETRAFLAKKMKEAGRTFTEDDFKIGKNEKNTVTISLSYYDEISVLGITLKELEFTIEKRRFELQESF